MATLTDVTAQPTSGYEHIDALLGRLPGWNWLAPARTELRYTFSLAAADPNLTTSQLTGAVSAFNAAQQAAVVTALAHVTALTGIVFVATADGSAADLHFRAGNLVEADNSGLTNTRQSYSIGGSEVTSLTADAWIYLDNVEFAASNDNPAAGTVGYEVLLHEIGHAMGLKHPFDGSVTLPGGLDNTSYTLMSYTHVGGPYAAFRPLDEAALLFLYGDDGLGGDLGWSSDARYLMGTDAGETLAGGDGDDVLEGGAGNDVLQGGDGEDTAVYTGALAAYTVSTVTGGVRIAGPDGTDTLTNVERARFSDFTIPISGGTGNNPPTGTLTITGTLRQGNSLDVTSTVADVDGLGPLTLRWQQLDGSSWVDIPGAVGSSYAPQQEQVGHRLRVVASYTDGSGHAESIAGTASSDPVANVNDAPTGALAVAGDLRQGQTVTASSTVADRDGLGTFNHQWSFYDATQGWQPISGATSASLVLTEALVGRTVRVVVDYVDGYGRAETVASAASAAIANVNDAPTGSVTITGTSREDQPLSAGAALADLDGLGVISWRWQAGTDGSTWADIAGATTAGFTPGDDQVGLRLRAVASYTDGHGTTEQVASAATAAVANVNDPAAGSFTLVGTAEQGQSLAALAVLKDADGLGTFTYEWQSSPDASSWTTIPGATSNPFLLGSAQVGQHVRAVVRYVDGQGTAESLTSSPSIATILGVVNGTTGNDTLTGSAYADRLTGDAGNDRLTGSGGNDLLNGGPGVDTAVYSGVRSGYLVAPQGTAVTASAGSEGRDDLQGIERLAFSDGAVALDLSGNAGTVAKFLGAVFGRESVSNTAYVGIGLSLLDGGMSADALMAYALEVRLGGGYSREAEVQLLYQNLAGVAPSAADVAYWTGTLASGQYTPVSLAVFAAEYELNLQNVGFTGLVQDGLPYTPAS